MFTGGDASGDDAEQAADGSFRGGAILPGIGMSARALHEFTDLLPLIEMHALAEPPPPVGDATVKLREMVLDGRYPGVKKQSELWSDAMPHAGVHVSALSGYCHFAAIYRTSPVGLKISRWKELTDEQHTILQKLAWETVSKYPYAGVAK